MEDKNSVIKEFPIKFYSAKFPTTGENSALTFSKNNAGTVVFDRTTKSIYVGGVQYGGSLVKNATFASNVLTITKADNSIVQLNFSSLATEESVIDLFKQLHNEIVAIGTGTGLGVDGTYNADLTTNYLKEASSLMDADKKLDEKIKNIEDNLNNSLVELTDKIANVDASVFVKDGMIKNVELITEAESGIGIQTPYIKITFNTDGPSEPIRFSVKTLVDTKSNVSNTEATIPINSSNATTIATIGSTNVTVQASFTWEVYEDEEEIEES